MSSLNELRKCKQCGRLFRIKKHGGMARYCSLECRHKARYGRRKAKEGPSGVMKKCAYCQTEFLSTYGRKYCTPECYDKANGLRSRNSYERRIKNCVVCGKELTGYQAKYCSKECISRKDLVVRHISLEPATNNEARCECKRIKQCIYGSNNKYTMNYCTYMEKTGHMRGGYPDECKYFERKK